MFENINRITELDIDQILTDELGSKYSQYREEWSQAGPENPPKFPIHLDFELNDLCNQKCTMCPRNEKTHPDINYSINTKSILSFDDFCRIIDEGVPNGLRSINLGAFAEPLIHKRVFDMVKYAHEKGIIDTRIITNGLLLHNNIDKIFDSGLVNLFVSLDAFKPETYELIRGKGFERINKSLNLILDERKSRNSVLPIIRVSIVDMENNHNEIDAFAKYWGNKVDFIDVQIFDNFNIDINKKYNMEQGKKWNCSSPWSRAAVLADGNILPCCNFFGRNVPLGNISKNSIQQSWSSESMKKIRQGILMDSIRNCSICQRVG
jgi:radical SAM protein with 4Fe4S-binding SPASM domain